MTDDQLWPDAVLDFWFGHLTEQQWWTSSPALDDEIRRRFADVHAVVSEQPDDRLSTSPRRVLAAVIVLDQMSRNMFRQTASAFAYDGKALALSEHAVAVGFDAALPPEQLQFLYMPFMHAEDRAAQARSLALFTTLGREDNLKAAIEHKEIVDRFERFPHRNAVLGRPDTPAEAAYLEGDIKRFGQ